MDIAATPISASSHSSSSSCAGVARSVVLASGRPEIFCFRSGFRFPDRSFKKSKSISTPREERRPVRRGTHVRASSSSSSSTSASGGESSPAQIAPLQLESPVGQFLSQILVNHPHLLSAAVDQQLQQLQTDLHDEKESEPADSVTDIVLYKRIAELKANERRRTMEEILYTLVVQKFMDANISLIPTLSSHSSGRVDEWPSKEEELRKIHSVEAYEMIQNHISLILGNHLGSSDSVTAISKFRVRQVYAASVMYGYFLKRVDQRYQLEKTMETLPWGSEELKVNAVDLEGTSSPSDPEVNGFGSRIKPTRLRSYVMGFDSETLQECATIRSKEAQGLVEKQTDALFGELRTMIMPSGMIDQSKDEIIKISFASLKRLIMEALTFGSFLWDVETYVDSRHQLAVNF